MQVIYHHKLYSLTSVHSLIIWRLANNFEQIISILPYNKYLRAKESKKVQFKIQIIGKQAGRRPKSTPHFGLRKHKVLRRNSQTCPYRDQRTFCSLSTQRDADLSIPRLVFTFTYYIILYGLTLPNKSKGWTLWDLSFSTGLQKIKKIEGNNIKTTNLEKNRTSFHEIQRGLLILFVLHKCRNHLINMGSVTSFSNDRTVNTLSSYIRFF